MGWRDDLRPASFRGVPFHWADIGGEGGRRLARHEYPLRDDGYVEDLGRAARSLTLSGYVLGDGYGRARDALIAALEQAGAGILVHPTMGDLSVFVGRFGYKESQQEGGICRFDIQFIRDDGQASPVAVADTGARILSAGTAADAALSDSFAGRWSLGGPGFIADTASTLVEAVSGVYGAIGLPADDLHAAAAGQLADGAVLAGAIRGPLSGVTDTAAGFDLLQQVASFATLLGGTGTVAAAGPALPVAQQSALSRALAPDVPRTPARGQQAANQRALGQLLAGLSVVQQARLVRLAQPATYDEAVVLRTQLADRIDLVRTDAADAGQYGVYAALGQVAAAAVRDLTERSATLARIGRYDQPRPRTAFALSQSLYETGARAGELAQRNRVPHPAFMPVTGEVLVR